MLNDTNDFFKHYDDGPLEKTQLRASTIQSTASKENFLEEIKWCSLSNSYQTCRVAYRY